MEKDEMKDRKRRHASAMARTGAAVSKTVFSPKSAGRPRPSVGKI